VDVLDYSPSKMSYDLRRLRLHGLIQRQPSTYRRHAAGATAGMPSCVAKQVTKPIRNREARVTEPQLE
jgi:hypothetical protein